MAGDGQGRSDPGGPPPGHLTPATESPPLPQGGADALDNWLTRIPDARLVVIDVFAKVRGVSPPGVAAYDADYAAIGYATRV